MKIFKLFASSIFVLNLAVFVQGAELRKVSTSGSRPVDTHYRFCITLTPEQIGFVIDTLEALAIDGVLINGQANSLVSKLEEVQYQLNTENITAVYNQLEDFIIKVNKLTKYGKLTTEQGRLLINSTLSVMCRT